MTASAPGRFNARIPDEIGARHAYMNARAEKVS
jgi:hypothetical protein